MFESWRCLLNRYREFLKWFTFVELSILGHPNKFFLGGLLDWRKATNSSTEDIGLPRAALKFRRKISHGSATSRREGRVGDRLVTIRQWLLGRERTGRGFDSAEIPVSEIVVSHGAAVLRMENNRAYSGPP
jgi:hypothetical protein